ncbi:(2Fe-2S)-binding protein [Luteolibacter luteus]|uniref:(2Fe-2S)-binding protein n=1 Tax=Luteolibacter luteus TaxID=2728835 RepID=A0A858RJ86_9BACT|nr:(2Fe-2S)-binding protein [Luteolibacter luteus]QJE96785.1 (2Fe-2S)-binding protein [Luteolibacter luteus]
MLLERKIPATTLPLHPLRLRLNGEEREFEVEAWTTLLDLLREQAALCGSKKGCDHGQCGACTVLINDRAVLSCLSLALSHDGDEIRTVEGVGEEGRLHPLQQAFIDQDAFQCGYCTSGQICSALALLEKGEVPGDDDTLREKMSGNLCRCGAYPNILAAIRQADAQMNPGKTP